ncbi:MAG: hypothetical protein M3067_03020 [Chloroflexota bacterium]|nr:hypothetical protein [Chloroflexota bacterium]
MSVATVNSFFDQYVYTFIFSDIRRELDLARSGHGGGNLLAALGLLCYTEFMGGIENQSFAGPAADHFNRFFDGMGDEYAAFRVGVDVYKVFRCGMAHEYLAKENCVIEMLDPTYARTCGVGRVSGGRYYFNVERYFDAFAKHCRDIHAHVLALPDPKVPEPKT